MRHYELLLVLKPTLTEEEIGQKTALMKEVLEKNGADIASVLAMGTRRLAYEVKKFERGTYFVFYFQAPSVAIKEIERLIRINEDIIKFMTVKFEQKKEIAHWEKLSNVAKSKTEASKPAEPEASKPVETETKTPETTASKETTQETEA